jgi:site-specific DNA-adenine methylase
MFVYIGSKRLELNQIRECEPLEFKTFVDVVGGAGNVYLDYLKRFPHVICVYNDFDECLSGVFTEVSKGNAKKLDHDVEEMFKCVKRDELITKIENGDEKKTPLNFLFLTRTSARGMWNVKQFCKLKKGIPALSPSSLQKYESIINNPFVIHNKDYRDMMNLYKNDETAFLYLDPPYNGKGKSRTTNLIYKNGKVYHDFLIFIEEFMKDPETKCKVMLNIDFRGDVYVRFKDLIKLVYPVRYSPTNSTKPENKKSQQYHVIITNY